MKWQSSIQQRAERRAAPKPARILYSSDEGQT